MVVILIRRRIWLFSEFTLKAQVDIITRNLWICSWEASALMTWCDDMFFLSPGGFSVLLLYGGTLLSNHNLFDHIFKMKVLFMISCCSFGQFDNQNHILFFKVDGAQFSTVHLSSIFYGGRSIRKLARTNQEHRAVYSSGISVINMFKSLPPTFLLLAQKNPVARPEWNYQCAHFWHSSHMLKNCDGMWMGTHDWY